MTLFDSSYMRLSAKGGSALGETCVLERLYLHGDSQHDRLYDFVGSLSGVVGNRGYGRWFSDRAVVEFANSLLMFWRIYYGFLRLTGLAIFAKRLSVLLHDRRQHVGQAAAG